MRAPLAHVAVAVALALAAASSGAQSPNAGAAIERPFHSGERLTYEVRLGGAKPAGKATMWVQGPVDVRGTQTLLLRFNVSAHLGPLRGSDRTSSWLEPGRMAAYRFAKHERRPLGRHDEVVELYPGERRWQAEDGAGGESPTDAPLDELSFIYFLRTIPLAPDSTYTFARHFDQARSPTSVRVVRRETVSTPAGEFATVLVEMRVRDQRHYEREGVLRLNLTDDALRLPVRIESAMPVIGTAVLVLERYASGAPDTLARTW